MMVAHRLRFIVLLYHDGQAHTQHIAAVGLRQVKTV